MHGGPAAITDFPYQVALFIPDRGTSLGQICGGVILNDTTVITAAHCVFDVLTPNHVSDLSDLSVLAGTADLTNTTSPPAQIRTVAKISFDPLYDPSTNVHDVAVLKLASALWSGSPPAEIKPIGFIADETTFAPLLIADTDFVVSGWGDTSPEPATGPGSPTPSDTLQSAQVKAVSDTACSDFYTPSGVPIDSAFLFCAGNHDYGTGGITDSCQGDSGGPIVFDDDSSPTVHNVLVGLVDSGIGCAQQDFPGIYTRLSNPALQTFLTTDEPQAPQQSTTTTVSGTPSPGQTLTCNTGTWTPTPDSFSFQFFRLAGGTSPVLASGQTYTVQESDRGTRIFCEVKATNAGGYGFGTSASVLVPTLPPPPPPPPGIVDSTAPRLKVLKKSCTKTSCTVRINVTDALPSSGLAPVRATLRWRQKTACPRKSKKRACFKTRKRVLRPKAGKNGVFTITASKLKPGTGYTITLVASDKAGNKPQFSTITNVRTKPAKRHRL